MAKSPPTSGEQSTAIDVGAQPVAAVYAKALLGASEKAGQTDAVGVELNALVDDVLARNPSLQAVFASEMVSDEEKQGLVDRVFSPRLTQLTGNFLSVLARHGRLGLLRPIRREFRSQLDALRGRLRVKATTAQPLDDEPRGKLTAHLKKMLAAEPLLEATVEPALIGGLVLRMGDTVYDGSLARQLGQLREQMIHRSVHEIQSRRDRFRLTGGN